MTFSNQGNSTKQKGGWKSKIFLLFLIIIFIFVAVSLSNNWSSNQEVDGEIGQLKNEINTLEKENLQFKELIDYFNSTAYIEEKARLDLGLKKPDEKVVIVADTVNNERQTTTKNPSTGGRVARTNPQRWWKYFFE